MGWIKLLAWYMALNRAFAVLVLHFEFAMGPVSVVVKARGKMHHGMGFRLLIS